MLYPVYSHHCDVGFKGLKKQVWNAPVGSFETTTIGEWIRAA